jgi:hypothetical protein
MLGNEDSIDRHLARFKYVAESMGAPVTSSTCDIPRCGYEFCPIKVWGFSGIRKLKFFLGCH